VDAARRLAELTLELVDIPSVSRDEARLAEHVRARVGGGYWRLRYDEPDCFLYATGDGEQRPLVVLAGHLDTVPPQGNLPGRIDGDDVVGLGASDMKGGLAVMIELARWAAAERPAADVDLGLLFFAREELSASESALPELFARSPLVLRAALVVLLEPTDNTIQAGCLGNVIAEVTFTGESAHSARPWLGTNAIDLALEGLRPLAGREREEVLVEGLPFYEVLSVTRIHGGIAENVVPAEVVATLNYRYAPTRTPAEAETRLRELAAGLDVRVTSNSPPARVVVSTALAQRLRAAGGFAVEPKQAWTPVAEFSEQGLDAVNLGPGATRYAHRHDERIRIPELVRTYEALQRFVVGAVA
jgi:succinyl-diaminopimelate desuccinylase